MRRTPFVAHTAAHRNSSPAARRTAWPLARAAASALTAGFLLSAAVLAMLALPPVPAAHAVENSYLQSGIGPSDLQDHDIALPSLAGTGDRIDALGLVGSGDPNLAGDPAGTTPADTTAGDVRPVVFNYAIQPGDTLWDIARRYDISVNTLIAANNLSSPNLLRVGQTIRVLTVDGVLHTVKSGDTLSGLAAKYKVDADEIAKANMIEDTNALKVGRELIVPGAKPVIVRRATTASDMGGRSISVPGSYLWPVMGRVTSRFGWRWGRFHHGIDIGAPYGRTIVAARSGTVIWAGWRGGYGYAVSISHGDGVTTLYGHASRLLVSVGDWVQAGQAIARVGSTGNSTGPHCHFEIRVNGKSVDPLSVLD